MWVFWWWVWWVWEGGGETAAYERREVKRGIRVLGFDGDRRKSDIVNGCVNEKGCKFTSKHSNYSVHIKLIIILIFSNKNVYLYIIFHFFDKI